MTPYRLVVSALGYRRSRVYKGRGPANLGAYTKIEPTVMGWMAWTPDQTCEPWRLPGSGSFLFNGLHVAYAEAMRLLALSPVQQVSVRTNQDRQVYRYVKHADGRISGYGGSE